MHSKNRLLNASITRSICWDSAAVRIFEQRRLARNSVSADASARLEETTNSRKGIVELEVLEVEGRHKVPCGNPVELVSGKFKSVRRWRLSNRMACFAHLPPSHSQTWFFATGLNVWSFARILLAASLPCSSSESPSTSPTTAISSTLSSQFELEGRLPEGTATFSADADSATPARPRPQTCDVSDCRC